MIKANLPKKAILILLLVIFLVGVSAVFNAVIPSLYQVILDKGNWSVTVRFLLLIIALSIFNGLSRYVNNMFVNKLGLIVNKT